MQVRAFVEQVIDIVDLNGQAHSLVGAPGGAGGLSTEQRKRLTIAVELVANPSGETAGEAVPMGCACAAAVAVMRASLTVSCVLHLRGWSQSFSWMSPRQVLVQCWLAFLRLQCTHTRLLACSRPLNAVLSRARLHMHCAHRRPRRARSGHRDARRAQRGAVRAHSHGHNPPAVHRDL